MHACRYQVFAVCTERQNGGMHFPPASCRKDRALRRRRQAGRENPYPVCQLTGLALPENTPTCSSWQSIFPAVQTCGSHFNGPAQGCHSARDISSAVLRRPAATCHRVCHHTFTGNASVPHGNRVAPSAFAAFNPGAAAGSGRLPLRGEVAAAARAGGDGEHNASCNGQPCVPILPGRFFPIPGLVIPALFQPEPFVVSAFSPSGAGGARESMRPCGQS